MSIIGRHKRLIVEVLILAILLLYSGIGMALMYNHGHDDGWSAGYAQGHVDGYGQGHSDGYNQGYNQGTSDGYAVGYQLGAIAIECWVIENHPIVYSLWFNNAFAGVQCP
jgi:hypothetical protein